MFSGFMINAWEVASIVAVVAGVVGFFIVLRGSAFVAHAVPNGSFAGAAGASLIGVNTIIGLGVFSLLGALGIGALSRRGRHDAVTALTLVLMLGARRAVPQLQRRVRARDLLAAVRRDTRHQQQRDLADGRDGRRLPRDGRDPLPAADALLGAAGGGRSARREQLSRWSSASCWSSRLRRR